MLEVVGTLWERLVGKDSVRIILLIRAISLSVEKSFYNGMVGELCTLINATGLKTKNENGNIYPRLLPESSKTK